MTTQETILVPVDFSEASHEALTKAHDLGARLGMEVVLLHIYEIPVVIYPGSEPILFPGTTDDVSSAARKALDKLAVASGGLRTILREGDPAAEILKIVEETHPAMVVMGTQGRRGLARLVLGSVAERVVRLSPAPVLTVHAAREANT